MSPWAQYALFAAALLGIGYFGSVLIAVLGRIADRLGETCRHLADTSDAIIGLTEQQERVLTVVKEGHEFNQRAAETQIERLPTVEQQDQWSRIALGEQKEWHDALLGRLGAISDALDDKKVRVMQVPGYPAAQNPVPQPRIEPNRPFNAADPAIQTLFGQVQAAGKAKRALEAESEALREQIAAEKARLEQLATIRTDPGRRIDDPPAPGTYIDEVEPSPGASETAFDDVMRRINAQRGRE